MFICIHVLLICAIFLSLQEYITHSTNPFHCVVKTCYQSLHYAVLIQGHGMKQYLME